MTKRPAAADPAPTRIRARSNEAVPEPGRVPPRRLGLQWTLATVAGAFSQAACSPLRLLESPPQSDRVLLRDDLPYGSGPRQKFDLFIPTASAPNRDTPVPLVVFFYGGNWSSGDRRDYRFVGQSLAARGCAVAIADYRLYPEVRYPLFLEDGAAAVVAALRTVGEAGARPARWFLMGHSAGAYNAAMLAFDRRFLEAAFRAAGLPAERPSGFIGLAGPYDFLPLTGATTRAIFGYPDTPPETQPIRHVDATSPPALLLAAAEDSIVDPGNSLRLAAALRAHQVPVRTRAYPRVGHATLVTTLSEPLQGLAPVLADTMDFIEAPRR